MLKKLHFMLSLAVYQLVLFVSTAVAVSYSNHVVNLSEAVDTAAAYDHQHVRVAVSGTTVHVVWFGQKNDYSTTTLFYRRSTDGGKTFATPIALASDKSLLKAFRDGDNYLAASGPYVHILYTEGFHSPRLYYLRSSNNGESFDTVRTLSSSYACNIYLTADGNVVTAAWRNGDYGSFGIMCAYSADGGATFTFRQVAYRDPVSYGTIDGMRIIDYGVADMVRVGNNIYILAVVTVSDGSLAPPSYLLLYASVDGGATFKTPLRVNVLPENGKKAL